MKSQFDWRRHGWNGFAGAVLALLAAVFCLFARQNRLVLLSYDMPVALHPVTVPPEAVIVYMDEKSHEALGQSRERPWDRRLHAQLLERLKAEGARLVVFDIIFREIAAEAHWGEPGADDDFAAAIRDHGNVVLAGHHSSATHAAAREAVQPHRKFLSVAKGWGASTFPPCDADFGIRQFTSLIGADPTLEGAAAKLWDPNRSFDDERLRWLHYYEAPGRIPHVSYFQVLSNWTAPGLLRDKAVFVGVNQSVGLTGDGKDMFATAFTASRGEFSPGSEIHATAFLNLIHGEWLTRMPFWAELSLAVLVAIVFGFGLVFFRALPACGLAALGAILIVVPAHFLVWTGHVWFAWAVLLLELGVALGWSVIFNSSRAYLEKRNLEYALELHLPKRRVKQILKSPALLAPSAEKQQVSLMFTDIADWSTISERVTPDRLFKLLNRYFQETIPSIHNADGMVLQLVGDAIFALWNAPETQKDHQHRACAAALRLRDQLIQFESANESYRLRTRVGLHFGLASVGNVGSTDRLVYTALGAETNMASRLEGLNKYLGTSILASDRIVETVEDKFVWRNMGRFRLKGGDRVMEIYELVDALEKADASRPWRDVFANALKKFKDSDFQQAEIEFRRVLELKPKDGSALFYLEKIEHFRQTPPPEGWMGEISMEEK